MLNFYLTILFILFNCINCFDEWAARNPLIHYDPYCQVQIPHEIVPSGLCVPTSTNFDFNFCPKPIWQFIVKTHLNISTILQIPFDKIEREFPNCQIRQFICSELGRPCLHFKQYRNSKLNHFENWALIPLEFCLQIRQNCPIGGILPDSIWQCEQRSAEHFMGLKRGLKEFRQLLFHKKCKNGSKSTQWMEKFGQIKIGHQKSFVWNFVCTLFAIIFAFIFFPISAILIYQILKFRKSKSTYPLIINRPTTKPPNCPPPFPPLTIFQHSPSIDPISQSQLPTASITSIDPTYSHVTVI